MGKSWLGLSGETVLLAAALVAEPAGVAVAELSTVVDTAESDETKVVGKATSMVVGLPSLRVLTTRAAVGLLDENVDVAESLWTNGPADAPRMVPDTAKSVARREVTRIVDSEGLEFRARGRKQLPPTQDTAKERKSDGSSSSSRRRRRRRRQCSNRPDCP